MSCGSNICFVSLILIILWLMVSLYSIKVYRFYRPGCRYCQESQNEWDMFKNSCTFSIIKPIDINMDTASHTEKKLMSNFNVSSVPNVVAVYNNGMRFVHSGERSSKAYKKWVNNH